MPLLRAATLAAALAAALIAARPAGAQETLRTAVDGTFAPHAMPRMDGGVEGFNVDLANAIGQKLGRKVDIKAAQFSGLIPALQAGTYDFLAAPTTVNEERASNLLFSEGFMDTNFAFVVRKADTGAYKNLDDFRGKTIAVNRGSAYDSYLKSKADDYKWKVESYGTNTDAVAAVLARRADAVLAGNTAAAWAVKQTPGLALSYEIKTGLVWALPFRKDSAALRDRVDRTLECLKLDGTLARLSEKWFGVTPEPGTTIVTPTPGYGVLGMPGYVADDHKPSCDNLAL